MACVEAKKKCLPAGARIDRGSAETAGQSGEMRLPADLGVALLTRLGDIVEQLHRQNELLEGWVNSQRDGEGEAAVAVDRVGKKKEKKKKDKKDKGKGKEKAVEEETAEKGSGGEETEE